MTRLYLVRHGEARAGADDAARSLTEAGRAAVERLGRAAAERGLAVAAIRHSGLLRARQTAEILAARLAPPAGVRAAAGLAPDDDPEVARAECEDLTAPVLLVGHLPHLVRLEARLTGRLTELALAPAGLLALERAGAGWTLAWRIG